MCEDKKATIQVSIGTCKKYVDDWEALKREILLADESLVEGVIDDPYTQINLTLEQAKTHGII